MAWVDPCFNGEQSGRPIIFCNFDMGERFNCSTTPRVARESSHRKLKMEEIKQIVNMSGIVMSIQLEMTLFPLSTPNTWKGSSSWAVDISTIDFLIRRIDEAESSSGIQNSSAYHARVVVGVAAWHFRLFLSQSRIANSQRSHIERQMRSAGGSRPDSNSTSSTGRPFSAFNSGAMSLVHVGKKCRARNWRPGMVMWICGQGWAER